MKKSMAFTVRAFPIAACVFALGFAAACGDRNNSTPIQSNKDGGGAAQALAQKTFPKYDPAKADNQNLAGRVIGVTAKAKAADNPTDSTKKWFSTKVSFLVVDQATQAASQVVAEGMVYVGQADDPKAVVDDGNGKSHRELRIKIKEEESSADVKNAYYVNAVCTNADCTNLVVLLGELIQKDETNEAKRAFRYYVAVFQGKADADGVLPMTYGPGAPAADDTTVDPTTGSNKTLRRGKVSVNTKAIKTSFLEAKQNFKGVVNPTAQEVPAAPAPVPAPGVDASAQAAAAAGVTADAAVNGTGSAANQPVSDKSQPPASAPVTAAPQAQPAAPAVSAPATTAPAASSSAPAATAPAAAAPSTAQPAAPAAQPEAGASGPSSGPSSGQPAPQETSPVSTATGDTAAP